MILDKSDNNMGILKSFLTPKHDKPCSIFLTTKHLEKSSTFAILHLYDMADT